MSREPEICCHCLKPTGHAGALDGSLYVSEYGPLCDGCYGNIVAEIREGWTLVTVEQELREKLALVELENEALKKQNEFFLSHAACAIRERDEYRQQANDWQERYTNAAQRFTNAPGSAPPTVAADTVPV